MEMSRLEQVFPSLENCNHLMHFIDPTWGVSENGVSPRKQAALFTRKYYEYDKSRIHNPLRSKMITAYDRCKANRRCNWGIQGIGSC